MYHKNQNVLIEITKKHVKVTALQNKSTPGIYKILNIENGEKYMLHINGIKKTSKDVKLWIAYSDNTIIHYSDNILTNEYTDIKYNLICDTFNKIKVGLLFSSPNKDDYLLLKKFIIEKTDKNLKNIIYIGDFIIFNNIKFYKNKIIDMEIVNDAIKIISKQSKSTPGIIAKINFEKDKLYKINIIYSSESKKNMLWIATNNNNTLETLYNSDKQKVVIDGYYKSPITELLKIGILFNNPKVNDELIIYKFDIKESEENIDNNQLLFYNKTKQISIPNNNKKTEFIYDYLKDFSFIGRLNIFNFVNEKLAINDKNIKIWTEENGEYKDCIIINGDQIQKYYDKCKYLIVYNYNKHNVKFLENKGYIIIHASKVYNIIIMENLKMIINYRLSNHNNYYRLSLSEYNEPLKIIWEKFMSIPIGIEETYLNIIDNKLVFSCGLNGGKTFSYDGTEKDVKYNKYIDRGLKNCSYYFDLIKKDGWNKIDNFYGVGRQAGRTVVINDIMYCWGGYKFTPLKAHDKKAFKQKKMGFKTLDDGYSFQFKNNKGHWKRLPDLPIALSGFGMTNIDNYIYICCGAHRQEHFECTQLMVNFNGDKCGDILYRLDVTKIYIGWVKISDFPGTLRFNCAMTSINNNIYIIGGIYPNHDWIVSRDISNRFYNVLDNWKFDINSGNWEQLNLSINNYFGNWGCSSDRIVYKNRYIILIGGYGYGYTKLKKYIKPNPYYTGNFCNNIYVYDTKENVCFRTNKLFCKINVPDYVIEQDIIHLIGGESIPYKWENETFGRHSDVYARGKISNIVDKIVI